MRKITRKKALEVFSGICISFCTDRVYFLQKGELLAKGSIICKALIEKEVRCSKSWCYQYDYSHNGKSYLGQMFTRSDIEIGDVIYVRVSTDDPSERCSNLH